MSGTASAARAGASPLPPVPFRFAFPFALPDEPSLGALGALGGGVGSGGVGSLLLPEAAAEGSAPLRLPFRSVDCPPSRFGFRRPLPELLRSLGSGAGPPFLPLVPFMGGTLRDEPPPPRSVDTGPLEPERPFASSISLIGGMGILPELASSCSGSPSVTGARPPPPALLLPPPPCARR